MKTRDELLAIIQSRLDVVCPCCNDECCWCVQAGALRREEAMTKEQEEEAWRSIGRSMLEQLHADCEAIVVKGYSPLRRWLRQERARANQEQLDSTPEARAFKGRFVFTFETTQFLVRH